MTAHPQAPLRYRCQTIGCDWAVKRQGALCLACQIDKNIPQPPIRPPYARLSKEERKLEALLRD